MQPQLLHDILKLAQSQTNKRIAVVAAHDIHVLEAVKESTEFQFVNPILIGDKKQIETISQRIEFDISAIEIIDIVNDTEAAIEAVKLVKLNKADIIMKGILPTAILLRAILDKENGLEHNGLLSHFAIIEIPSYHKLLSVTDGAINITPTIEDKKLILKNALNILHTIGYNKPKVAILCPIETVNPKIVSTVHAAELVKSEIGVFILEGPLAFDNAISKEAAKTKGITGKVVGDADLLLVPDLNSGNILYKSLCYFAGATSAAIVAGASVPIVLTSRTDSAKSKFYSIALATCI